MFKIQKMAGDTPAIFINPSLIYPFLASSPLSFYPFLLTYKNLLASIQNYNIT